MTRLRDWTIPALLVAGILLVAVGAAVLLSASDRDRDRELRDARLSRAQQTVEDAFAGPLDDLALIANAAAVAGDRAPDAFKRLATPVLEEPVIRGIGLVERVPEDQRAAFERRTGIGIVDIEDGNVVPAPARPVHYASLSAVSREPTTPGADSAADPERVATIERAIDGEDVALTPPVSLLREGAPAVISVHPAGPDRVVMASLTYDLIAESLAERLPQGTAVAIDEGGTLITRLGDPGPDAPSTRLTVGDRVWTVRTQVNGLGGTPWAWLVLAFGLLLAAAVGAFAAVLRRRERDSRAQAGERAAERDAATADADRERGFSATLLQAMPDAFAADDRNGLIVANDALCALTGYTRQELLGRRFPFGLFSEDSLVDAGRLRDRLDEQGRAQMELMLRTRSGERIPVLVSAGTVQGADGPVRINVLTDNRDRAAARERLEQSETRLRELAEAAPDVVLRLSLAERVEWASPSTRDILGLAPDAIVGSRFRELFEDSGAGSLGRDALVASMRRPDGSVVWIETTITPTHDADGETTGMRASIRDVTAREERTRSLALSEERYRTLAGALPGMVVFMTDLDLRFVLAEGGALASAGFRREDIEGRRVPEVLSGEGRDLLLPHYEAALRGEESELEHGGGATDRQYHSRFMPLRDSAGSVEGVMVVSAVRDKARVLV